MGVDGLLMRHKFEWAVSLILPSKRDFVLPLTSNIFGVDFDILGNGTKI